MKHSCLVLLFCGAGCMDFQEPAPAIEAYALLPFSEIGRGRQALVDTVHRTILTSAEWVAFQDSLRPLIPFAPVDFSLEMVVVAAIPVPGGGYDLRFEEFQNVGETILARYRLYVPGSDCRPTVGDGNTFQAVRVAHSSKAMTFERIEESLDCTEP